MLSGALSLRRRPISSPSTSSSSDPQLVLRTQSARRRTPRPRAAAASSETRSASAPSVIASGLHDSIQRLLAFLPRRIHRSVSSQHTSSLVSPSRDLPAISSTSEEVDLDSGIAEFAHPLQTFVNDLAARLTDLQKRALRVTWKRLSEAPKTSGRGTIHIMEKVWSFEILEKLVELESSVPSLFYKSAFLSCVEDRRCWRNQTNERRWAKTIATLRDHAHILVTFIDAILQLMFDGVTVHNDMPDPDTIGLLHNRLYPLGFNRRMWQVLGECFAEVFFMQDCVRAYPHAASAWSLLCVAFTDRMYAASKPTGSTASALAASASANQLMSGPPPDFRDLVCPRRSTARPLELPLRCPVSASSATSPLSPPTIPASCAESSSSSAKPTAADAANAKESDEEEPSCSTTAAVSAVAPTSPPPPAPAPLSAPSRMSRSSHPPYRATKRHFLLRSKSEGVSRVVRTTAL